MYEPAQERPEALDKACFVLVGIDENYCYRPNTAAENEFWGLWNLFQIARKM